MRPPDPSHAWTAEIEWGRLDGQAGFRACARQGLGAAPVILAESPPLDWPPSGPDSVEALTRAVRTLNESLLAAGWQPLRDGGGPWYAKRFAWQPESAGEPAVEAAPPPLRLVPPAGAPLPEQQSRSPGPFARTPAWPEGARELWRCEIAWNAGWADSSFEAVVYRPKGRRGRAIGASSAPRWLLMRQPDGASPEIRLAVQHLAAALVAAGWSPAGLGLSWYSQRFLWRRDGAPPEHVRPAAPGPVA
jgi:hypothetical protein